MPAWPGGPCPECGDDVPAKIVHCRNCRTLLNEDLYRDSVEVPQFFSLPELDSMIEVTPSGFFLACDHCQAELRIAAKYLGRKVQCRFCTKPFWLDPTSPKVAAADVYADCPACHRQLRFASKYCGRKVACRYCSAKLNILQPPVGDAGAQRPSAAS